jgi:hypothetical protein
MNLLRNSQLNVISVLYFENAMLVICKQQQLLINTNLLGVIIGGPMYWPLSFPSLGLCYYYMFYIKWRRGDDRAVVRLTYTVCNKCVSPFKLQVRFPSQVRYCLYIKKFVWRVWRNQRGNHNSYIEKEQTTQ